MVGSYEDQGRSMRLGAEDRGWLSIGQVLSDRTIERSGDTVCGRAQGYEEHRFLGLASKPCSAVSPGLASKPMTTVLLVSPQNHSLGFSSLDRKTSSCGLVIWPTKS
jgi:hypothetical protein